jgi:hypothetical protein
MHEEYKGPVQALVHVETAGQAGNSSHKRIILLLVDLQRITDRLMRPEMGS